MPTPPIVHARWLIAAAAAAAMLLVSGVTPLAATGQQTHYELHDLIELGLEINPDLESARYTVDASRASLQAARLLRNPTFDYTFGNAESWDGTEERRTSGLTLGLPIENPFKRHHRIGMSEAEWRTAQHTFHSLQLDITYEIETHFYMIRRLQDLATLAEQNVTSLEEALRLVQARVELGEARELEAIRLRVESMRARNELNATRSRLDLERRHLNTFLGNRLPSDFTIGEGEAFAPAPLSETSLQERMLLEHPRLALAEAELERARSQLSYARSGLLPDPTLSGFVAEGLDGRDRGLGVSLEVPLWNMAGREIAESRNTVLMKERALEAIRLNQTIEVSIRLSELRITEASLRLFHEGLLEQAEQSLRISEVSYNQGEISLLDYLDAQRIYYSVLKDYADTLYAWHLNRAALERAIGGDLS